MNNILENKRIAILATDGFEEIEFSKNLKSKHIPVFHINNPVYHLNVEENSVFLKKTEDSLKNLIYLEKNNILDKNETNISSVYHYLRDYKLSFLLNLFYDLINRILKYILLKKGRPLYIFDLYKLLYFSKHY